MKTISPISPIIFCSSSALLAQAIKQLSREATVLLLHPGAGPTHGGMAELADRVFCIYNEQAGAKGRGEG